MCKSLPTKSYPTDLNGEIAPPRIYQIYQRGLYRAKARIKESNLNVISDKEEAINIAIQTIYNQRILLEDYIRKDLRFRYALKPIRPIEDAPEAAKLACRAAEEAEVGPMAALPGALADLAVKSMGKIGCRVKVVENGGEVSAATDREICVALYAGNSPISSKIGFVLEASCLMAGLATSSATISHAISFGEADAAVVYAEGAALADAAATRICNVVRGDDEAAVQKGLEEADKIDHIYGVFIVKGRYVGRKGRLPKIVKIRNLDINRQIHLQFHTAVSLERYF
ncbi:MAG: UPF0280 family protein [Nitrososphaerales archaeon]